MVSSSEWSSRGKLWALIAVATALRLAWATSLGPGNDEAYHALFARHPDWSYFDHPPMLALVARAGLTVVGDDTSAVGLRLGFIALFAGSTWLMARLAGRAFGIRAAWPAALALNVSGYFGLAAGTFALPDGPLVFFWLLTLDRLAAAFERPASLGRWAGAGLAWGGALLSKYHAVFLPLGAVLFVAVEPRARAVLRRPGPYLAGLLGLLVFSPVLAWNAQHHWASFAFQGARAVGAPAFRPKDVAMSVVGPLLYLFPWIWLGLVRAGLGAAWRVRDEGLTGRFLLCEAVVPLAVFGAVSCVRPILPHWPLVGYLALLPLLGRSWAERIEARPLRMRRVLAMAATLPIVLGIAIAGQTRAGWFQDRQGRLFGVVKPLADPSVELYFWEPLTEELRRRGLVDRPGQFLFTNRWYQSAQLAFTLGDRVPVACYTADPRNFAYWSRPSDWVGRDGLLVAIDANELEPEYYRRWFRRIEPVGVVELRRAGSVVRTARLYRCEGQTWPFPFAHEPPTRLAARGSSR
ncbi:MAG TPA: glycosyltransferase family 39 protein [Isosphaeraceae bacterium]|jgi:4-amino-4-deoxy-L-arabinose transferase-like glycosyltransferase|nr:glycosyltransferase family 39 protein [Isosphaeraceae bacterium]